MTDIHSCSLYCDRPECIKAQRDELRDKMAQPAPVQEPVAWAALIDENQRLRAELKFNTPPAAQPAPVQKPMHPEIKKLYEDFFDKHFAETQREWVGLTEEDKADILSRKWWDFEDMFDVDGFLRLAEAKLKEKNS